MKGPPTNHKVREADIVLNKQNVTAAKYQRLMQSWHPSRNGSNEEIEAEEDEEDSELMSESAGIGVKEKNEDGLPDGLLQRKHRFSDDKLLEQLLGKKAAKAHREGKRNAAPDRVQGKHAAPNSTVTKRNYAEALSEDEDEEGRATAFRSKKVKSQGQPQPDLRMSDGNGRGNGAEENNEESPQQVHPAAQGDSTISTTLLSMGKPARRKPDSYLDELLAANASRKSKKKKHKAALAAP